MKFKKALNRDIVISSSHNGGFIVKVGCCVLAYGCADDLLKDLKDYLENSESIEKEYAKNLIPTAVQSTLCMDLKYLDIIPHRIDVTQHTEV